jgi:hypothetical protein
MSEPLTCWLGIHQWRTAEEKPQSCRDVDFIGFFGIWTVPKMELFTRVYVCHGCGGIKEKRFARHPETRKIHELSNELGI